MAQFDVYKLVVSAALYGSRCINVFHYDVESDAGAGTNEADILERFLALVIPPWELVLSEDYIFDCMDVTKMGAGSNNPRTYTFPGGSIGLITEPALPPNRVFLVSMQSATFTKQGRGRKYLSGVPVSWEDDNAVTSANRAALETLGTAMIAHLVGGAGGGDYRSGIWSPTSSAFHRSRHNDARPQIASLRGRTAVRCT